MNFLGKLLLGTKGILSGIVKTALPNLNANIASKVGGVGKQHLPTSIASWTYAFVALVCVAWTMYRLYNGENLETIEAEQELINNVTK